MDNATTQPAWASRTNQLIIVGLLASWATRAYGVTLPVEAHGIIVDFVPVLISAVYAAALWFRVKARKAIDRWL